MRAFLLFLFILNANYSLASIESRISRPTDPAKRCVSKYVSSQKCEDLRKKALEINCIIKEEYDLLKKYGSYPSCNFLRGEGLDMLDGWCPCGCFSPATEISVFSDHNFLNKKIKASDIIFGNNKDILVSHLSEDSSFGDFSYKASKIRLKTHGKESKKIYRIKPKGRKAILLTERHPVLLASGIMKQIKDVDISDKLVLSTGKPIPIESIKREPFRIEVVNFSIDVEKNKEHLIFANDLVIGDQYWQASLEDLLNQVFIRGGSEI